VTGLSYVQGLWLGVLQGLTEFLPVSSSGHLVILQQAFGLKGDAPEMLLFDIMTHMGTLLAVLVVFGGTFGKFLGALVTEGRLGYRGRHTSWWVLVLAVVACVPTAAIGLGFEDRFTRAFNSLYATGVGLLLTGTLLFVSGRFPRPRRGWRRIGWWRAALVGVAQGAAILPGLSRSGSTIATAMMLGMKRRWAAQFSFLIVIPPILGASLIQLRETFDLPPVVLEAMPWGPIMLGSAVSFVVGVGALRILLRVVIRDKLRYFSLYCWPLGIAILIWAAAR